jgi:hypothetical protein
MATASSSPALTENLAPKLASLSQPPRVISVDLLRGRRRSRRVGSPRASLSPSLQSVEDQCGSQPIADFGVVEAGSDWNGHRKAPLQIYRNPCL